MRAQISQCELILLFLKRVTEAHTPQKKKKTVDAIEKNWSKRQENKQMIKKENHLNILKKTKQKKNTIRIKKTKFDEKWTENIDSGWKVRKKEGNEPVRQQHYRLLVGSIAAVETEERKM